MQPTQIIIILLLIANLLATFWFGTHNQTAPATPPAQQTVSQQLPAIITEDVRADLLNQFIKNFNAEDYDALFDMLGPAAQAQIDKESTMKEFEKLARYFHGVEEGAFTHAQLSAQQGSTQIFNLNYLVKLPASSEFGPKGHLIITLAVQGDSYQVFGLRLNSG